jgi:hypothetical protein
VAARCRASFVGLSPREKNFFQRSGKTFWFFYVFGLNNGANFITLVFCRLFLSKAFSRSHIFYRSSPPFSISPSPLLSILAAKQAEEREEAKEEVLLAQP